ncbi:hypothetical protein ACAG39_10400 [Caldicellulosiruptoraceae bacterium PP1]
MVGKSFIAVEYLYLIAVGFQPIIQGRAKTIWGVEELIFFSF